MKRAFKRQLNKLIDKLRKIKHKELFDDIKYAEERFLNTFGYKLNLKNPKTFNEKLQWLKLYDRTDLHTLCADKYLVREHVRKEIGEEYLIPLVLETNQVKNINKNNMPDYPVIAKTNHDCGSFHLIRDKEVQDWEIIQNKLQKSLDTNYYDLGKEWQYKNIKPTIILEKLIIEKNGTLAKDYKFFCYHGKVEFIQIDIEKESKPDVQFFSTPQNKKSISPPKCLTKMISLAETLTKPFLFSRIDFYELNNKIFFGEITFHPSNGFAPITPEHWDEKMGDLIKLPR